MTLFVFFPFATFYLGIVYEKLTVQNNAVNSPPSLRVEDREDLRQRCGALSFDELQIKLGPNMILNGPDWAPDCRHIAWSLRDLGRTDSKVAGVYVYDDKTKKTQITQIPTAQEVITFERWKDSDTVIFSRKVGDKTTFEDYSLLPTPAPTR